MKRLSAVIALSTLVLGLVLVQGPAALAGQNICPTMDGKWEVPGGWEGAAVPGITVEVNGNTATITVADGFTLDSLCYKAGQLVETLTPGVAGPGTFTFTTSPGGPKGQSQDISHITFEVSEGGGIFDT